MNTGIVNPMQLDKYARDPRAWRDAARINYASARELFTCENKIITCITGATLGHIALEMFLKGALILEGCTVFNPRLLNKLDVSSGIKKCDCVWDHELTVLAKRLAVKRPDFDLSDSSKIPLFFPHEGPMTLEAGFGLFDLFFSELRYPGELKSLSGVGPSDVLILDSLVKALQVFFIGI